MVALCRSQSAIVIAETVLLGLLLFGTYAVLVRTAGMEVTGLWILLNSILGFTRVADFWSRGLSSFVGEKRGKNENAAAASFVTTAVITAAVGYLLIVAVAGPALYFLADQVAGPVKSGLIQRILPLMCLTFWFLSVSSTYQMGFLGFGRPELKAIQTVGGAAVFLVAATQLAPVHGIWGILYAQAIQSIVMLLFGMLAFHFGPGRNLSGQLWEMERFRQLIIFGSKAVVIGGLQMAIDPLTKILASLFGGLSAVTLVELAARLVNLVREFIVAPGQVLIPGFAREAAEGRMQAGQEAASKLYSDANSLTILLTIPAFCILVSSTPLIEWTVLGEVGTGFVELTWILTMGAAVSAISGPAYFLLMGRRQLRPLFWANLMLCCIPIIVGLPAGVLGGLYGAMSGVSIAFVVSSVYTIQSVRIVEEAARFCWRDALFRAQVLVPASISVAVTSAVSYWLANVSVSTMDFAAAVKWTIPPILLTGVACVLFGRLRSIPSLFVRIRS